MSIKKFKKCWKMVVVRSITANGLGLAEGVEFEIQMFNLAPKPNSIPNAEFSTNATLLANPCCAMWLFGMLQIFNFWVEL